MHALFLLIISFYALLWAGNHLVTGASGLAFRLRQSPLIIGLTLVAIGTSLPDNILSIMTSIKNIPELTLENSIGANIANMGLILGITILMKPTTLKNDILRKTYPIVIIGMLFAYKLMLDGFLGKIDGCLFLIACVVTVAVCLFVGNQEQKKDLFFNQLNHAVISARSLQINVLSIVIGFIVLPISSKYLLVSATELAMWFGMSKSIIGLIVLAIGTTLPELTTAIIAALRGEEEIAVGTILGANCYNLLLFLSVPTLFNPNKTSDVALWHNMPFILSLMVLLFFMYYTLKKQLSPWHGGMLLIIYFSYIVSLIIKAA